jgi:hypothetical protein
LPLLDRAKNSPKIHVVSLVKYFARTLRELAAGSSIENIEYTNSEHIKEKDV